MRTAALFGILLFMLGVGTRAGADIPSLSVLEEFIQKQGGAVPFPYEKMLDTMRASALDPLERRSSNSPSFDQSGRVPLGRSLQRKKANIPDPRDVTALLPTPFISVDRTVEGETVPPNFIGHASKAQQLELLSWNPSLGRYEFLVVENYGSGLKPTLKRANRQVCLACHQNGGPLFPRSPWSELNVYEQLRLPKEEFASVAALGTGIDEATRLASRHLQAAKVCRTACKNDLDCRRAVLAEAFLAPVWRKNSPQVAQTRRDELRTLLKDKWPVDQFAYPSSVLPDRKPLANESHGGTVTLLRLKGDALKNRLRDTGNHPSTALDLDAGVDPTYLEDLSLGIPTNFSEIPDQATEENLPYDASHNTGDPLTPRPKVGRIDLDHAGLFIEENADLCFDIRPSDRKRLESFSSKQIEAALSDPRFVSLLKLWPPGKAQLMNTLSLILSKPDSASNCCENSKQTGTDPVTHQNAGTLRTAIRAAEGANSKPSLTSIAAYRQYCGDCHLGPDAAVRDLHIQTIADMRKYVMKKTNRTLADRLKDGSMPPGMEEWSDQERLDWEVLRDQMIRDIEGTKNRLAP